MKALPFTIYQFTQYWVSGEVVTFSPTFRRVFFRLHLQKFVGITAVGADTLGASRRKIRVEPPRNMGGFHQKKTLFDDPELLRRPQETARFLLELFEANQSDGPSISELTISGFLS